MTEKSEQDGPYAACRHEKREKPNIIVDNATLESFSTECNILPLFEKKYFDYVFTKHYSLQRNNFLICRWREFLKTIEGRQRTPFQFPDVNDYHFYLHQNGYAPSQSVTRRSHYRNQMGVGPGVDSRGQMPIPDDMHIRKSVNITKIFYVR